MSNKKGVFKNFSKLTGNHLWRSLFLNIVFSVFFNNVFFKNSDTGFFLSIFWNFWEHLFLRILQGDCFLIDLMVKKFNVSLIFLNLQRYHAPPEWSLLYNDHSSGVITIILVQRRTLVNEENVGGQFRNPHYLWMKQAWARFDFLQNLGCIGGSPKGSSDAFFGAFRCILGQPMI